jgi:hypothetical protein
MSDFLLAASGVRVFQGRLGYSHDVVAFEAINLEYLPGNFQADTRKKLLDERPHSAGDRSSKPFTQAPARRMRGAHMEGR